MKIRNALLSIIPLFYYFQHFVNIVGLEYEMGKNKKALMNAVLLLWKPLLRYEAGIHGD